MDLPQAQQSIEIASRAAIAGGSGVGLLSWLSTNSDAITAIAGIVGITVAIIGLAVNWYYKHKASK